LLLDFALHFDRLRLLTDNAAPECAQILEVLIGVVLDTEVRSFLAENSKPPGRHAHHGRIGIADGDHIAVALASLGKVEAYEVAERGIGCQRIEFGCATAISLFALDPILTLHGQLAPAPRRLREHAAWA
jgi:hypothetical protein